MISPISPRKWIVLSAATLITVSIVTAGVFSARRQRPNEQKVQKRVVELPEVVSHVPKLRIVSVIVKNPATPEATAQVEILNTSHLAVMCVEISTKNAAGDSGGVNEDGLTFPDKSQVVIPPYGTKTLEMQLSNMVPDAPLVVSAAFYADGSEEGDQWSRDAIRAVRAHYHALWREEKEKRQKGVLKP
jgi:hypothetical protein